MMYIQYKQKNILINQLISDKNIKLIVVYWHNQFFLGEIYNFMLFISLNI